MVSLDLGVNVVRLEGARIFCEALRSADCRLTSLSLAENNVGVEGASLLADVVADSTRLRQLNLDGAYLPLDELRGDAGGHGAVSLEGKRLKLESAVVVAALLRANPQLRELDLRKNNITQQGAAALAAALATSQLRTLRLGGTGLGPGGAKIIAEAVPASQLTTLDVDETRMKSDAAAAFAAALRQPACKLTAISLRRNYLPAADEEMLRAAACEAGVELTL